MVFTVAILGGESSGKTTLAGALQHMASTPSTPVAVVPEHLRTWVAQHKRTPLAHEQLGIAQAHSQAAQTAYQQLCGQGLLLLDTTPVMTAAYSAHYFNDHSLWDWAFTSPPTPNLYLLMGLDIAWHSDGLQRDSQHAQHSVDALLRSAMTQRDIGFHIIYGLGEQRTYNAWQTIQAAMQATLHREYATPNTSHHQAWGCQGCGDPDCERRLFRSLLGKT